MTIDQILAKLPAITGRRLALAEQAINAGIAIVTDKATGKRCAIATSKSGNGCYTVTGLGCSCPGYANRSRCCHFDAVALMIAARSEQKEAAAAASPAPAGRWVECYDCGRTTPAGAPYCVSCQVARDIADLTGEPIALAEVA